MQFRNPFRRRTTLMDILQQAVKNSRATSGPVQISGELKPLPDFGEFARVFESRNAKADPAQEIVRLREYWGVPKPAHERFKVGDLCQPKPGGHAHGNSRPHLVVEVLAEPIFYAPQAAEAHSETPSFSKCWGQRLDMRVIHVGDGEVHAHWVESWAFEPWPENPAF